MHLIYVRYFSFLLRIAYFLHVVSLTPNKIWNNFIMWEMEWGKFSCPNSLLISFASCYEFIRWIFFFIWFIIEAPKCRFQEFHKLLYFCLNYSCLPIFAYKPTNKTFINFHNPEFFFFFFFGNFLSPIFWEYLHLINYTNILFLLCVLLRKIVFYSLIKSW